MCILRAYPVWHTGFSYTLYGGNICSVSAKCQPVTYYVSGRGKFDRRLIEKKEQAFESSGVYEFIQFKWDIISVLYDIIRK